jgi:hypothetical protein
LTPLVYELIKFVTIQIYKLSIGAYLDAKYGI